MTETELLKILNPQDIFPNDENEAKTIYRKLARKFHPDLNFGRDGAFKHLNELYNKATTSFKNKVWETSNTIQLLLKNGKQIKWDFLVKKSFELGEMFICKECIIYVINKEHTNFVTNALNVHNAFIYASDKMKEEFEKYLPKKPTVWETSDDKHIIKYSKPEDYLNLRDIIKYDPKIITPQHVAWIMNSLFNLNCYLFYAKLSHNDITLDSFFISPKQHGCLLFGWWYWTSYSQDIKVLPKNTFNLLPWTVRQSKKTSHLIDQELIRSIGRKLLGPRIRLNYRDTKASAGNRGPLIEWMHQIASLDPIKNYGSWNTLLKTVFGDRKFVELNLTQQMLYNKQK